MPVFAPGTWAGINDALAINRQNQRDQLDAQEKRQRMQAEQLQIEQARQQQARDLRARQGFGAEMYGVYGAPPAAGGPPPGPGPQPPMPGQSSAPPPQQPGAGGPPPPQQPQGGPPPPQPQAGAMGGPMSGPPQDPALHRAMMDVAALQRELATPGDPQRKAILTQELGKAQAQVAQLKQRGQPYQAVPSGLSAAGGQPQAQGMQGPPPVSPTPAAQPSLLQRFVRAAQQNGVPPEDLADQIKLLSPIMQDEMKQELMTLRGTQAEQNLYIRQLMTENAFRREDRLKEQGDRKGDQADERIKLARERAAQGAAPTKSELADPETARVFYDIYKTTGRTPPFAWGKAGENDRSAWMQAVKRFSTEDGGGAGIAASQAEGKATASALSANEKRNAGLDVGARETLKDMNTLDGILDRVATKGGAKVINRPLNRLRDLGSDPDYAQLELATKQVATKYERMLAGGILSVAQLHEGAREDAKKILSGDMTVQEMRAKLPLMRREMENAQKAGKATSADLRNKLSGKPREEDDEDAQAIAWAKGHAGDPRAKKILQMHGM